MMLFIESKAFTPVPTYVKLLRDTSSVASNYDGIYKNSPAKPNPAKPIKNIQ